MSRGEAQQLELIGMTSVTDIDAAMIADASRVALAVSTKSADAEAPDSVASFETEE